MLVDYSHSTSKTKARKNKSSKITALLMAEIPIQLGKLKDNSKQEKKSLKKKLEKRILATSQMKEVLESLRYPKSEESMSEDCVT